MNPRFAYWILGVLFTVLVAAKFTPQTGFISLIRFGEAWQDRRHPALQAVDLAVVPDSNGYDGQFYAQIALDPSLRDARPHSYLDLPEYRARRIFLPAVAHVLGLGAPRWILQVYALLNVACWLLFAWVLIQFVPERGWTGFARWAGCLFSMGVLESVRQSLVDLPAVLLLSLAISAQSKSRPSASAFWLALGNLTKETNLLGSMALWCPAPATKPTPLLQRLLVLVLAALPLALWSVFLHLRLSAQAPADASSGINNFTWPLLGLCNHLKTCFAELLAGNWDGRFSMGIAAALGFIVQACVLWQKPDFASAWWRIGAAYSLLLLMLGPWVWSGYWAASRALLPMTIAFNLLLPAASRLFWPLWIAGNFTLLHAVWRFL